MSDQSSQPGETARPGGVYQFRVEGHLRQQWVDWFEGLTITLEEDGSSLLTGEGLDQAALHGILKKIRDLGIPLLSVYLVGPGQEDTAPRGPVNDGLEAANEDQSISEP